LRKNIGGLFNNTWWMNQSKYRCCVAFIHGDLCIPIYYGRILKVTQEIITELETKNKINIGGSKYA